MHLQRVRRTGEVGEAASRWKLKVPRKDRNVVMIERLRELHASAGRAWRIISDGRGECLVTNRKHNRNPKTLPPLTLRALERRGYLAVSGWHADGSRTALVTRSGLKALA